jgi:hypothetical protein
MRKLFSFVCILMLFATIYGQTIALNNAGNYLRASSVNSTTLRIEYNLESISFDAEGKPQLPSYFAKYSNSIKDYPLISFHVAVNETGDFHIAKTVHQQQTQLAGTGKDALNGEVVTIGKPYWLRELRGVEVIISPFQLAIASQ